MSKEVWFAEFERLDAEHPELSDEDLSEMASERLRDQFADKADQVNDERWIDERSGKHGQSG